MSNFSLGMAAWKLSFQLSPIILNNGVASFMPGGLLPIIALTEAINFTVGILGSGENIELDSFFANYQVLPGDTIIDQQIGHYPFANQAVAANAVIAQPLRVSMLMVCPVRQPGGYLTKLATMISLQNTLKQHNASGGTYTVVTPAAFYPDCVMTCLTDVSNSESKQVQTAWRWDFEQPLLTLSQAVGAQQAYNATMGRVASGTQTDGALSGTASLINAPFSAMAPSVIPAASGTISSSTAISPVINP